MEITMTKIPVDHEEWEQIKQLFIKKYSIDDTPETWLFILSQLLGTKMPELYFSMESIYHHYKRWKIAEVLQKEKMLYVAELEAKLKKLTEEALAAELPSGSPGVPADVPPMPEAQEAVVPGS